MQNDNSEGKSKALTFRVGEMRTNNFREAFREAMRQVKEERQQREQSNRRNPNEPEDS